VENQMTNPTLLQFFHWYYPSDGSLWNHCASEAKRLSELGITHVWLPPAYKSAWGADEPGYAVYDLFDLGEFDQRGTVRTKYGTKEEYLNCINELHKYGIQVLADVVFNHRTGADETELIKVQMVDFQNRTESVGEPIDFDAFTKFTFPGRAGKYSTYIWDYHSFTGFSQDDKIYRILNGHGDNWDDVLEHEYGNFDYLMGADTEFRNPNVREELKYWGRWYVETTGVDGFRLDAVKHMNPMFIKEWLDYMRDHFKKDFFTVSEYWQRDVGKLVEYIDHVEDKTQLFDAPLHYNFYEASYGKNSYDLRHLFENTLTKVRSMSSVTFVDNHDSEPFQSLESFVDFWFKPLAYSTILLREQGIPCVFYVNLYGAKYEVAQDGRGIPIELQGVPSLEAMIKARKHLAYGLQRDYFDHGNTIGWTREGIDEKPNSGLAVILTNGSEGNKVMEMGKKFANKTFIDITRNRPEKVTIDENGFGDFKVNGGSVSVWILDEAKDLITR